MYTSASSPAIKITRAILYGFLFISSIVLIVALTDTNARGVSPQHSPPRSLPRSLSFLQARPETDFFPSHLSRFFSHQSEFVKLEHPVEVPYPQPWPTDVPRPQTPTREASAVQTGAVEKRNAVPLALVVDDLLPTPVFSASSAPAALEDEPYPYPGWPFPRGRAYKTHEICYLYDRNGVKFLAIAGLVTAISIVVVTFILPTLDGTFLDFLSYFGLEALFTVLLFALWSVVAGFATKEAVELLRCSNRSRIGPLILTFAWLGFFSALVLAAGFLAVAIVENSRGNKKIWTSRFQDFIFGEQAIRLPTATSDDLSAPIVASG